MRITIEIDQVKAEIVQDNVVTLTEALSLIGQALRGVGFYFDGELDIVDE